MRSHAEDFMPFIGEDESGYSAPDFEKYCKQVESITQSVWGGQLEINAISAALKLTIDVFSADSPVVTMGKEGESKKKLRISYHKHYFSLGEHYNSIVPK